ncbi:MAG: sulfite exporter TauE/SafE family protein [Streptomyces sp.]
MDISIWGFAALAAAAVLVGFSKTAVSGANTVSLAVFAAVLPARESTGVLLPILIAGDVLAVLTYRRHAHWPTLWRLFPAVAGGVVVGTVFLMWADDAVVRTSIGAILLMMATVTLWRRRTPADEAEPARRSRLKAPSYGVLGGFTTMVANAGGPVMAMYLLSAGFRKLSFLGTSAWFFLIVNTSKVPFSVGLGLIDAHSLLLDAALVLFVLPGALIGKAAVHRINQRLFEQLVIGATVLGGLQLLLR